MDTKFDLFVMVSDKKRPKGPKRSLVMPVSYTQKKAILYSRTALQKKVIVHGAVLLLKHSTKWYYYPSLK